jgi:hypothetical protein
MILPSFLAGPIVAAWGGWHQMTELNMIHIGSRRFGQFVTGPVCHATILSHRFSPIIFASALANDQTFLIVISASERYQRRRSRGRPRRK